MKQCPRCRKTYNDDNLNFCLDDGELLTGPKFEPSSSRFADDPPPTVLLGESRITNPASWPQSPMSGPTGPQGLQQPIFASPAYMSAKDKTLPTISLILGIASILLICCYGGIWLGVPAAILGFLGMRNSDTDPARYEGRSMAIGGMVLGGISFLASIGFAFIAILTR